MHFSHVTLLSCALPDVLTIITVHEDFYGLSMYCACNDKNFIIVVRQLILRELREQVRGFTGN